MPHNSDYLRRMRLLREQYRNPASKIFLVKDAKKLHRLANEYGIKVSHNDIRRFQTNVESISRSLASTRLKGAYWKRRFGKRMYRSYAPNNIVCGDLAFLRYSS